MRIGIIAAESKEMMAIKKKMNNIIVDIKYNMNFYIGNIYNHEIILIECGVGKVNAARTTQTLIDTYNVDYVINMIKAQDWKEIENVILKHFSMSRAVII